MIHLLNKTGCKADLVAVGAVSVRGAGRDSALGQFAGDGVAHGCARVGAAGYAHGLIHIGTAGERVADRPAQTGCRAAERLDFRRMVVRLVFEHQQVFFRASVYLDRHAHGAGVDLLALVEIL